MCLGKETLQPSSCDPELRPFDHLPPRHLRRWLIRCISLLYFIAPTISALAPQAGLLPPSTSPSTLHFLPLPHYKRFVNLSALSWAFCRRPARHNFAAGFNPRSLRNELPPLSLCNFDQALMWLGSDPDVTRAQECKRNGRVQRRKRRAERLVIWPEKPPEEERNYSEGVFSLLLPLPCG